MQNDIIVKTVDKVIFFTRDGQLYQNLTELNQEKKVCDGKMRYITIKTKRGFAIKYNLNGTHGFSIWGGNTCLENNFWSLEKISELL